MTSLLSQTPTSLRVCRPLHGFASRSMPHRLSAVRNRGSQDQIPASNQKPSLRCCEPLIRILLQRFSTAEITNDGGRSVGCLLPRQARRFSAGDRRNCAREDDRPSDGWSIFAHSRKELTRGQSRGFDRLNTLDRRLVSERRDMSCSRDIP